ncbi:MAG TPA: MerR family transcriptional regulator [Actinomycetota bacterium]|nr:MerR family transcriptional regulator [Actinomycetota bacterium]
MGTTAFWTLDELTRGVAAALAVDYDGQASGRVRDVPDQRAIRYYTTLGLVDRPAAMRGRTALYGPRHLLQLVAIKRLQARGLSLAAVQAELAGVGEADLERIARVPPAPPGEEAPRASGARASRASGARASRASGEDAPRRFWAASPAPAPSSPGPPGPLMRPAPAARLQGIRLSEEATLLIGAHRPVDDDDVRALQAAARPLLEALAARGLAEPAPDGPTTGRDLP